MKRDELTRGILSRYRELSERRALQHWRNVVPRDVRRLWIRRLLSDIARDKIVNTPEFEHFILQHATPRERQYIQHTKERLEQAPRTHSGAFEDESIDELSADYYNALQQVELPDEALEQFAELYFLSFRTERKPHDKKITQRFSSEVLGVTDNAFRHSAAVVSDPAALRSLVYILNDNQSLIGRDLIKLSHSPTVQFQRQPPFTDIVVCGSAAIGPRTSHYPGQQDIDFIIIPRFISDNQRLQYTEREKARWMQIVFGYIEDLSNRLCNLPLEDRTTLEETIQHYSPNLHALLQRLHVGKLPIDIHLPEEPLDFDAIVTDWPKLCGPHTVQRYDTRIKSYERYLERAIRSARASVL